jgi:hypothetical protein
MKVKETVKKTIHQLESLCKIYEKDPLLELNDLEETVMHLSYEVQSVDLASDQTLKTDLSTLQNALGKLSGLLKNQQDKLAHQANELNLQQRALHAYAKVANNNLGSFA